MRSRDNNIKKLRWEFLQVKNRLRKTKSVEADTLDRDTLNSRYRDLGGENLKVQYSLVKAIGLTTATIILLNILLKYEHFDFSQTDNCWTSIITWWKQYSSHVFILKILLWLISCIALIQGYDAAMFGTTILVRTHNRSQILTIFSFIGFEFFLFALLHPSFVSDDVMKALIQTDPDREFEFLPNFSSIWFLVFGIYLLCISNLCRSSIKTIKSTTYHSLLLKKELIAAYNDDKVETLKFGIASIAIAATPRIFLYFFNYTISLENKIIFHIVAATVFLLFIFWAFHIQAYKRNNIIKHF